MNLVVGNILDAEVDYIVIPVNCYPAPGRGLALEWHNRFPKASDEYKQVVKAGHLKPGEIGILKSETNPIHIVAATKDHFKDPSRPEWIKSILEQIKRLLIFNPRATLAIPPIGGGLGWNNKTTIIKAIQNHLKEFGDRVTLMDIE